MSGLSNDTSYDSATRLGIGVGKDEKGNPASRIVMPCGPDTPGAKTYFNADGSPVMDKNGNPKYRLEFGSLTGTILGFEERDNVDVGGGVEKSYTVIRIVDDEGTVYALSIEKRDRYWVDFFHRLPLVDITKPVKLTPRRIQGAEFPEYFMSVYQGPGLKVKIERAWKKENDYTFDGEKLPPPEEKKINGKVVWDFDARDTVLGLWAEEMNARIADAKNTAPAPTQPPAQPTAPDTPPAERKLAQSPEGGNDPDDLPF